MRTALIAGASGLVGRACLRRLLGEPVYTNVVALVRRPLDVSHPKLRTVLMDVERADPTLAVTADDAFCALGTTLARAGSKEAFRAVDYAGVLAVADLARQGGARQFVFVSSVGADPATGNFYLSVKGDTEAALGMRGFGALHVLRPGLLLGERQASRPAEAVFRSIAPALNLCLVGPLRRYRAIGADRVGVAMVASAIENGDGLRVLHYDEIMRLSAESPRPT